MALALALTGTACDDPAPVRATLSVADALAEGDTAGFARADQPRSFAFPADHGPHPEYRHEWWYFTGNLEAPASDDDFGFQLTFFRSTLRPEPPSLESDWATSQAWMAHFALTDVAGEEFAAFERFERQALGLAGASTGPLRVWVGDWEAVLEQAGEGSPGSAAAAVGPAWRVRAAEDGVAIDLRLEPLEPVVLQGERGLSRKGPEPGNASYYYSLMRLRARGTVTVRGREVPVAGSAWLDREWGTSALGPDLAGWDWLALQLDTGAELMLYRLRRKDGGTDRFSAGTYVGPTGEVTRLAADDFVLAPTGSWTSPAGVRYPSGWRVEVPELGLDLRVQPRLRDQELDLTFRYWEGAVAVQGSVADAVRAGEAAGAPGASGPRRPVRGVGYVELTGYDDGAG